jgi:dolichol-phosphate mannosyltransferase
MGEFAAERQALSNLGAWMSNVVCRCHISDPMSGFFMLRRPFFMEVAHRLSGTGFKILVDLVASAKRPVRLRELPYVFRSRVHGVSKLDLSVAFEYLLLLADKVFGQWVPARYVLFGLVGLFGALLHICFLWVGLHLLHLTFSDSLMMSIGIVMVLNFFGNNQFTYRDRRLHGTKLLLGLISFCIACSIGAFSNYRLVETLQQFGVPIYLAAFCGALVGSVWNYAVTAIFTWRSSQRRDQDSTS